MIYDKLIIQKKLIINFKMLENDESPKNSTQLRIIKLLDELNISEHDLSKEAKTKSNDQSQQISDIKSNLKRTFQNLNDKVDTAISMISQVQKQKREIADYKRKLRLTSHFEEGVQDVVRDSKQFYKIAEKDLQQQEKFYANRIMETKLRNIEFYQNAKHELKFYQSEIMPRQLEKVKKCVLKGENKVNLEQNDLRRHLKGMRKKIEEDEVRSKVEIKKMKQNILEVFEKIQEDLLKQEQNVNKSFDIHFQSLQRIVASVSDKI